MSQLVFPHEQLAYGPNSANLPLTSKAGVGLTIYTDAGGLNLAAITDLNGVAIAGSRVIIDNTSLIPFFKGPDGYNDLYAKPDGQGTLFPLYARIDDRLDNLESSTVSQGTLAANYETIANHNADIATALANANSTYVPKGAVVANVKDYGDTSTGVGFRAALVAAANTGRPVYIPAGSYTFAGAGLAMSTPLFVGEDRNAVTITLPAGGYFLDSNTAWLELLVTGITFSGGAGAIRNQYTAVNVQGQYIVDRCKFSNYSGAAISHNAPDMPYWKVTRNIFYGANTTSTIGVALSGIPDQSEIANNEFLNNAVHVKLAKNGENVHVHDNDFIQFTTGTGRISGVWLVPSTSGDQAHCLIEANKFGNENQDVSDYQILIADEGAGTLFGDRLPTFTTSTGTLTQLMVKNNQMAGGNATRSPLVYSTTPNIRGCEIGPNQLLGSLPPYVLQLSSGALTANTDTEAVLNVLGPVTTADNNFGAINPTNAYSLGATADPQSIFEVSANAVHNHHGVDDVGYLKLLTNLLPAFTSGGGTQVAATDSRGGTDAATLTLAGSIYSYLTVPPVGSPVWIELDVKAGGATPVSSLQVLFGPDTGAIWYRRILAPPTNWTRYRFLTAWRGTPGSILLKLQAAPGATGTTVLVGRVRVYSARDPLPDGLPIPNAVTVTTAPAAGTAGALPTAPSGYVTAVINGAQRQIAYY